MPSKKHAGKQCKAAVGMVGVKVGARLPCNKVILESLISRNLEYEFKGRPSKYEVKVFFSVRPTLTNTCDLPQLDDCRLDVLDTASGSRS